MPITSKDLLEHLSDLQLALEDYSFEKMTVEEARVIKKSYDYFRKQLETRIWDPACKTKISGETPYTSVPAGYDGALEAIGNDLRNPLHGIIGFAQILSEAPIEEPYKSIASSMHMASESMAETLKELGAYSRIKNGNGSDVTVPFSLASILQETTDYARLQLLEKPVEINLEFEKNGSQTLMGNPSDLRRILLNLIENACRFTASGQIRIVAAISKNKTSPELCIEISDTGIGIPDEELPHVFKPYYQGKQAMDIAAKGTGFGLSIVQQLVAKQAGRIEISSKEGKGSKVRMVLPYIAIAQTGRAPEEKRSAKNYKDALKGKRVLILESHTLNLELLQCSLEEMGCVHFSVPNASEGIRLLESQPMDILLLDLRFQNKKDRKALEEIRTHRNSYIRNFPILGMSADMKEMSRDQLEDLGIDGLLLKPYTQEALFEKLKEQRDKQLPETSNAGLPLTGPESETGLFDLSYLESKCPGDLNSLNILIRALRNGMLEFAGRTRIGLKRHDYKSIAAGAEKLLIALEMIKAQSLIPPVTEILVASRECVHENRIVRAYSDYLNRYPKVADALERHMGTHN